MKCENCIFAEYTDWHGGHGYLCNNTRSLSNGRIKETDDGCLLGQQEKTPKKKKTNRKPEKRIKEKDEICQYCTKDPIPLTEEKAYEWDSDTEKIVFTKHGAAIETGDARRIPIDFCPKCGRCLQNLIGEET